MTQKALQRLLSAPIAHRGLHGCGHAGPVENSLGAAQAAIAGGFGIECDVQLSRDGEVVVFHDEDLERLTGIPGPLGDLDATALTALTLGGGPDRIPTLAAFLAAIDSRTALVIEIKSNGNGDMRLTERVLGLLAKYGGTVALESFDPGVVVRCRELGAPYPLGLIGPLGEGYPPVDIDGFDFVSWSIDHLGAIPARYRSLPCTTWTVHTRAQQALAANHGAQIVFEGFVPLTDR